MKAEILSVVSADFRFLLQIFFKVRLCAEAKLRMALRRVTFPSEISEELMTERNARLYAANKDFHSNE